MTPVYEEHSTGSSILRQPSNLESCSSERRESEIIRSEIDIFFTRLRPQLDAFLRKASPAQVRKNLTTEALLRMVSNSTDHDPLTSSPDLKSNHRSWETKWCKYNSWETTGWWISTEWENSDHWQTLQNEDSHVARSTFRCSRWSDKYNYRPGIAQEWTNRVPPPLEDSLEEVW